MTDISAAPGILKKRVVLADQVITGAGTLTIAHGLGVTPNAFNYALVCQTGEFNYTAADVVRHTGLRIQGNDGMSLKVDGTNVVVRFGDAGSTFTLVNWTTGVAASLTNANWKIRIEALYYA